MRGLLELVIWIFVVLIVIAISYSQGLDRATGNPLTDRNLCTDDGRQINIWQSVPTDSKHPGFLITFSPEADATKLRVAFLQYALEPGLYTATTNSKGEKNLVPVVPQIPQAPSK